MCMFKLRPHHALCIHFFEGKGYSNEFTNHMSGVIGKLKEDTEIQITCESDDICSKCPNLKQGTCVTQEKVNRYDKKVMELCGFYSGQKLNAMDFLEIAKREIINKDKLKEVCGDCAWKCGR